jgi:hypothetical protein
MLWSEQVSAPPELRPLAWVLACAAFAALAVLRGAVGQPLALVPHEQQGPGETYLVVRVAQGAPEDALDPALLAIADDPARCLLGPPPAEARRWLDAHILSLLPREAHSQLAERLEPEAIRRAIAGAHARLASPFAGLVGDDLRRDPLALRALSEPAAGRLGFLSADAGPTLNARGDLVAADGRRAVLCFRPGPSAQDLWARLQPRLAGHPVELALAGAAAREDAARSAVIAAPRLLTALAAALTLLLALALRRVRPVLALLLAVTGPAALLAAAVAPLGLHDVPLLALAVGVAAAPARPDLAVAALSSLALAPLLLTPYPALQKWAALWALAVAAAALARAVVQPALLAWLGGQPEPPAARGGEAPPPLRLRWAIPAACACATVLALGAWSFRHVRPPMSLVPALADAALADAEAELRGEFFAPDDVAVVASPGDDLPAALERAALDLPGLRPLLPAARLDAPGAYVVPAAELAGRQESLHKLDIRGRLELLRAAVAEHGMRPDAFAEFVRGVLADLDDPPTAESALDGPLGAWLRAAHDPAGAVVTRVYLSPGSAAPPPLTAPDGRPLALRGPGAFARAEQARLSDRAGVSAAVGAWLAAFVVWLTTRRLALALALALAAIAAQCGLVLALDGLGRPFGAPLLPAFLLTGALAAVAGLRATRSRALGRPAIDPGRLAHATGPLAAALALLTAPEPAWRELGLAVAVGVLVAHAVGGLAGPALHALLDRAGERLLRRGPA